MNRLILTSLVLILSSCSMNKLVISYTTPVLQKGVGQLYRETDIEFAKAAIPGNIKLLEGLWSEDKDNRELTLLLVQGYAAYALGYLEDTEPLRAAAFYQRSFEYSRYLFSDIPELQDGATTGFKDFKAVLTKLTKDDLERVFWMAMAWGNMINFDRSNPASLVNFAKVQALMDLVLQWDESYYYGGAHLFWASYYGSLSPMFGGDPEKSKMHFEKALDLGDHKFLMTQLYYAKFYAVQVQDKTLFNTLLNGIIAADDHILPGMELPNVLAKARARALLAKSDELF
jgi:hypothetical protein